MDPVNVALAFIDLTNSFPQLALSASVSAFTFGGQLLHAAVLSKLVVVKNIYLTCGVGLSSSLSPQPL